MIDAKDEARAFGNFVEQCFAAVAYTNPKGERYPLRTIQAALVLESGLLASSDLEWPANSLDERHSVIARLSPGVYLVDTAALDVSGPNGGARADLRVTLVRVRCSGEEPAQWVPAECEGEELVVEVSRGVISLWDWSGRETLREFQREGVASGSAIDAARERAFASGNSLESLNRNGHQILLTKCGLGADDYFVWYGVDATGTLAQVAIDLRMISWMSGSFEPRP